MDVQEIVTVLRREGSDNARFEAKRAAGGFPGTVTETLSAFANTPGGGTVLFGVDEQAGFAVTGVYDTAACQKAVVSHARNALEPPVTVSVGVEQVDGRDVVVAVVPEADPASKPVRVKRSKLAYLRQYDGDYPLSHLEEQAFVSQRHRPVFDEAPVDGARLDTDLDAGAVSRYAVLRREVSPVLVGASDREVLVRTGVITREGVPTLAGLLALGVYPQQYIPNLGIQASLLPASDVHGTLRALDLASFTGSVPRMLHDAQAWVRRITPTAVVEDSQDGRVVSRPTFPQVAVRELVANALVHRDLGSYALDAPITLKIDPEQLLISNPGGLYGLHVETLGLTPSHLRNARLAEILQYVESPDGARVIERLGTGIPAIRRAVATAGMPPPVFVDQGIRFTAKLLRQAQSSASETSPAKNRTASVAAALNTLGSATSGQIQQATGMTARQVKYALSRLTASGGVTAEPLDGRSFVYTLVRGTT
ncbi:MAG: putative DNA binding domain-containing protein [Micrococcales bacterium]|nr:putative DNA binding domain-containing protein [Micrococcales bacterium]